MSKPLLGKLHIGLAGLLSCFLYGSAYAAVTAVPLAVDSSVTEPASATLETLPLVPLRSDTYDLTR